MLVLVTNRALAGAGFLEKVEETLAGGVTQIILREKDMELEDLTLLASQIKKLSEPWGVKLFINSSPERAISVAKRVGADGIHLTFQFYTEYCGEYDRENQGHEAGLSVGVSVHSEEEVRFIRERASILPSYLLAGNVFETPCKEGLPGRGLGFLKSLCEVAEPIPVVAIGGISTENIREVMTQGAAGAAVMGAFMKVESPRELAKILRYRQLDI